MPESCTTAEADSHSRGVGPRGEGAQIKHGLAPAVNGQCYAKDSNYVHYKSSLGLKNISKTLKVIEEGCSFQFCNNALAGSNATFACANNE